jgi:hypothetical protein
MRLGRPSLGFILVIGSYALTLAFFAWGLSTPPLDRVWQLHHELKIGRAYALTPEEKDLLSGAMRRHSALAAALLPSGQIGIISAHRDGWIDTPEVTLIRTPRASTVRFLLDIQTPPQHMPYKLELSGKSWHQSLEVSARGQLALNLPAPPAEPELLTLKLNGPGLRADPSSLGVRISFDPPESLQEASEEDEEDDE